MEKGTNTENEMESKKQKPKNDPSIWPQVTRETRLQNITTFLIVFIYLFS
jgi:hypothetical protein